MALMDTLMTPRIDAKIRRKLLHTKYGRPDFKDILRERFKNQIKQNRTTLLDKIRQCRSNEVRLTLSDWLANEVNEIEKSDYQNNRESSTDDFEQELEILHKIQAELVDEELSWITNEYRKLEEEIQESLMDHVVCPCCKRGILKKDHYSNPVTCSICNLRLPSSISLDELRTSLRRSVEQHSVCCRANPNFFVSDKPNVEGLIIVCYECYFTDLFN